MHFTIEHLGLPSRDPKTLKDWYVRTLGAEAVFDNGRTPAAYLLRMTGGVAIEIYPGETSLKETSNNKLNGWRHLALRVDSIEAAKAELEQRGVQFTKSIDPAVGGGRVLFFEDPEGNLLHFVERSADSPMR